MLGISGKSLKPITGAFISMMIPVCWSCLVIVEHDILLQDLFSGGLQSPVYTKLPSPQFCTPQLVHVSSHVSIFSSSLSSDPILVLLVIIPSVSESKSSCIYKEEM